jgi:MSHA biogenesis protein MshP
MNSKPSPRQKGFAAIAAVFLVVTLAALGAFMITFSNTEQLTSAQDLLGARAYWAAKGGLAWGLTQVNTSSACPVSPNVLALDSFSVTVTCAKSSYSEGGVPVAIYQIQSTARPPVGGPALGALGYAERSVSASFER